MNSPLTPNSRSYLNHFTQPDSIIPEPGNPADYNRYAYSRYNPVTNVDPSGHRTCTAEEAASGDETCDQNIDFDAPPVPLTNPPIPPAPPDELLQPGYEWVLVQNGTLSYYYIPGYNSNDAGVDPDPNNWSGEILDNATLQGSVIVDGVLWKYSNGTFFRAEFCGGGGIPVGTGCLGEPKVTGFTDDGQPVYSVDGAVAACPPGGGGTNACGTPGFIPAYQQGGPPLYVNVPGNAGYVLIVDPIDSGGGLGETQIDIYAGVNGVWDYLLNNPYPVWKQIPTFNSNPNAR